MTTRAMVVAIALAVASVAANAQQRTEIPTVYEAGHFYATPTLANGRTLRMLVDTGGGGSGGWMVFLRSAVERAGLASRACSLEGESLQVVPSLEFRPQQGLPLHSDTPCDAPAIIVDAHAADHEDGQLGAGYLPGHVWTFDYPAHKLWLEPADWRPGPGMRRVALGVARNAHGDPQSGFTRITVFVAGEPIHLLLDTGATAHPTDAGKRLAGTDVTASGIGVTSYITTSQIDRWHRQHPTWRMVDAGDDLGSHGKDARLIEVPHLLIAGWDVGPVWFTERADANFAAKPGNWLSVMDGPIIGALGANVYRHFRMTIDYPHAALFVACNDGCQEAAPGRSKAP